MMMMMMMTTMTTTTIKAAATTTTFYNYNLFNKLTCVIQCGPQQPGVSLYTCWSLDLKFTPTINQRADLITSVF